jgi:hypothetical protein
MINFQARLENKKVNLTRRLCGRRKSAAYDEEATAGMPGRMPNP